MSASRQSWQGSSQTGLQGLQGKKPQRASSVEEARAHLQLHKRAYSWCNVCYTCPRSRLPWVLRKVLRTSKTWAKAGARAAIIVTLNAPYISTVKEAAQCPGLSASPPTLSNEWLSSAMKTAIVCMCAAGFQNVIEVPFHPLLHEPLSRHPHAKKTDTHPKSQGGSPTWRWLYIHEALPECNWPSTSRSCQKAVHLDAQHMLLAACTQRCNLYNAQLPT